MCDGVLIVFEGVEGAGKTTQIRELYQWLLTSSRCQALDRSIVLTREPGGTSLGVRLRQLLLEQQTDECIQDRSELLLYAADRAQHVEAFIKPHLRNGAIVLCDRYTDSTIAYQGYGRGLDLQLIEQVNQLATGGLVSDLTFWLEIDVKVGLSRARQRGSADRIEQAELMFHQRVDAGYRQLAQQHPDRIVRIDAQGNVDEVFQQVKLAWQQRFPEFC
ncbi:MAG: dTMP kinase [Cyanobacteria bacterium]|nr:dTMP kinase [Cyanobacteriota bacterium]MDW8201508.1 dTMP kinase [Cyanobacteriota bacterium SKYGB_h_bin112]